MFSADIQKNIKKLTTTQRMSEYATAALVPVVYLGLPSLMGLSGWKGWWAGTLSTVGVGLLFDIPGMISGGIATGLVHLGYSFAKGDIEDMINKPLWNFEAAGADPTAFADYYDSSGYMNGLSGPETVALPDGSLVTAYTPTELPPATMNDYYEPTMNDDSDGLMDYDNPFLAHAMGM